jgi:hypothetical protein
MATTGPGAFRTPEEREVGPRLVKAFEESSDDTETRLASFPRYIRRSHVTRFIALYELFKLCLPVKGSVIDCGVFRGFSLMTWAHLSAVLEPTNLTRRIYGFDSFEGFPSITREDAPDHTGARAGDLAGTSLEELRRIIAIYDTDRFLGHLPKVHLVPGNVLETVPRFLQDNSHLVVSLLFLDLDLFEPTRIALQSFVPRMPKGAVLAFDELDNPIWPGETSAVVSELGLGGLPLRRFEFDPYVAYAVVE